MNELEVQGKKIIGITYILGLLNVIWLGRLVHENGLAFLSVALLLFLFFAIIFEGVLPDVLGKFIRGRRNNNQIESANLLGKTVLIVQVFIGTLIGLILFFGAEWFAENLFQIPLSYIVIKLIAPALVFRAVSATFQGYFQGMGSLMPTVSGSILRQILLFCLSIVFCTLLKEYGSNVSLLLKNSDLESLYGVMGIVVAIGVSEFITVIYYTILFLFGRAKNKQERLQTELRIKESFFDMIFLNYATTLKSNLVIFFMFSPIFIGFILFQQSTLEGNNLYVQYGAYFGKFLTMCMIPICVNTILILGVCSRTLDFVKRDEERYMKECIGTGFHFSFVIGCFFSVFFTSIASQITNGIWTDNSDITIKIFRNGSWFILVCSVFIYLIIQFVSLNNFKALFFLLGLYEIIFMILMILIQKNIQQDILSLIYANNSAMLLGSMGALFFYIISNQISLLSIQMYLFPAVFSIIIGLLSFLIGKLLTPHTGELFVVFLSFIVSVIIYCGLLKAFHVFSKRELNCLFGKKTKKRNS